VGLPLLSAGCDLFRTDDPAAALRVVESQVTGELLELAEPRGTSTFVRFTVTARFENQSNGSVFVEDCPTAFPLELVRDGEGPLGGLICQGMLPEVTIPPGEAEQRSQLFLLCVEGACTADGARFQYSAGDYRVVGRYTTVRGAGDVPDFSRQRQATSNRFRVALPVALR
jgi:hypothetical protein